MSDYAIRAYGLGKSYQIRHTTMQGSYRTLREDLVRVATMPLRRSKTPKRETFWALKDVSFDVRRGEVLGIIGRNGAGKSTLLKILSRITKPTTGHADLYGRVGSLLEVGTGFNPELTGRENIYLNGTILGMTRADIQKRFDEIVAFAEVEQFLDTPVKRYSSGMYMRLAFAVAAHLEPEILIVDEVLAVGDAAFQKKCLGKMSEVAHEGRTVLFVSHNMAAVQQLCGRAIMLDSGSISCYDATQKVISAYLNQAHDNSAYLDFSTSSARVGSGVARFQWVEIRRNDSEVSRELSLGDDLTIRFGLFRSSDSPLVKLAIELRADDGLPVAHMIDVDSGFQLPSSSRVVELSVKLCDVRLFPGVYYISLWAGSITSTEIFDYLQNCITFTIVDGGSLTMRTLGRQAGIIFLTPDWTTNLD